jgi:hypothetical protein
LIGGQAKCHFAKCFSRVDILISLGVGEASPSYKDFLMCPGAMPRRDVETPAIIDAIHFNNINLYQMLD